MLKERLLQQRVSHPKDAVAKDVGVDKLEDLDDAEEEFTLIPRDDSNPQAVPDRLDGEGNILPDATDHGAKPLRKICAQFGRRRSHNKQIFVAPCGTIIARETFFGAEAISSVAVSLQSCIKLYLLTIQR